VSGAALPVYALPSRNQHTLITDLHE